MRQEGPKEINQKAAEIARLPTGEAKPAFKGGKAGAKKLSGEKRSEIAGKAAQARWIKRRS
jgi:hypothetical protein